MLDDVDLLKPVVDVSTDGAAQLGDAVEAVCAGLAGSELLTIVLNDPQRDTDSPAVLERLTNALGGARCRGLIAAGTHRFDAARRQRFQRRLGEALAFEAFAWHDCRSEELATLAGEHPWRCHPWLADGDAPVLAIGSAEPHYFAGITGAHKTVTVGCAAFGDIEANHAAALSAGASPGRLAGNPVHDGVAAMLRTLQARREVLAINLLQVAGRILAAAAGPPLKALEEIAPAVRSTYFVTIPSPADALLLEVTGALGESFYQADKAIKNNEGAVRDGGALVLEAPCRDGIGQDDFLHLLRSCPTHAAAAAEVQRRGYRLGDHKAVKLRCLTDARGVRVFVVGDGLTDADARLLGFEKSASAEDALAAAGIDPARDAVCRVADAGNTCVTVAQGL